MKLITLLSLSLFIIPGLMMGQKGVDNGSKYGKGEDSIRCLTNLSLYSEYYRQKNYNDAFPYWEIVFNECPLASSNIYSHGANIIKNFLDTETDIVKKEAFYVYLMKVYDNRIKYFGNSNKYPTAYIYGIKAVDILRYKKDLTNLKLANDLLSKAVEGRGNKTQAAVINLYMSSTVALFKANEISDEKVVGVYTKATDILDYQLTSKSDEDDESTITEVKADVEKMFAASGAANCEVIQKIFSSQFAANKTNTEWLKRVSSLLDKGNCENDLVYSVSVSLFELEPSATAAKQIAIMCLKNKETDKAMDYYKKAIELETSAENKGTLYYQLGLIYMSQDSYGPARSQFQKAIELRPGFGLPYLQIGRVYAASANRCGSNAFEQKVAFWAAIDKFVKAKTVDPTIADGANEQINIYSVYYPNKEEIFFQGLKEGDSYTIGCWMNETTTVRAKR